MASISRFSEGVSFRPASASQEHLHQPYVRIWIWLNKPLNNLSAATYRHVALETHTGTHEGVKEDQIAYISFWGTSHPAHKGCNHTQSPHFHVEKALDDLICEGSTLICYDLPLNIEKIRHAFNRFKANPQGFGSLGYNIFHRPYQQDAAGLSIYLLDKGGIFHLAAKKRNVYSVIFPDICFWGMVFSTINYVTAAKLKHLGEFSETVFSKYIKGISLTIAGSHFVNKDLANIYSETQELLLHDQATHTLPILIALEKANKYLNKIFPDRPGDNVVLIPSLRGAANESSVGILRISKIAFGVALVAFALFYLNNRYLIGEYEYADVERLAQQALQTKEKEAFKKKAASLQPKSSFYTKIRNSISSVGTSALKQLRWSLNH